MNKRSFDVTLGTVVLLVAAWAVLAAVVLASLAPLGAVMVHPAAPAVVTRSGGAVERW